jgi:putative flippase GtrA
MNSYSFIERLTEFLKGFEKYLVLVFFGIIIIYGINYIGVEFLSFKPQLTYFIATGINYVISYLGNAKIFEQQTNRYNLYKFIIVGLVFFGLNNFLFHVVISSFGIHYLIAIAINMIIFPIAKFLSYKYIVFKDDYRQYNI